MASTIIEWLHITIEPWGLKGPKRAKRDNASFHKRQDTQLLFLKNGHTLLYLPPYSPDLNPIEHTWGQLKAIRRKLRSDVDTLFQSI